MKEAKRKEEMMRISGVMHARERETDPEEKELQEEGVNGKDA